MELDYQLFFFSDFDRYTLTFIRCRKTMAPFQKKTVSCSKICLTKNSLAFLDVWLVLCVVESFVC